MLRIDHTPKQLRKIHIDSFFTAKYQISSYSGCAHQCVYCDGRSERYYFDGDFNKDLFISITTPDHITKQLKTAYEKGPILIGSGYTDAYQPIEKKFKLTRNLLIQTQPFMKSHPIVLLTKSDMVLRDLDIIKIYAKQNKIVVIFSLITDDDALLSWLEPHAPSATRRLKAMEILVKNNIPVGVAAMPMIPFMTDRNHKMLSFFKRIQSTGAQFIIPGSMTLRPGENKRHFLHALTQHQPQYSDMITQLYTDEKSSGMPRTQYLEAFYKHTYSALKHINLPPRIPMHITKDWFLLYDAIDIFIEHLSILYSDDEARRKRLDDFRKKYHTWLATERNKYKGKKTFYNDLEQATSNWLLNPFNIQDDFNTNIKTFLLPLLDAKIFDYKTKKWYTPTNKSAD